MNRAEDKTAYEMFGSPDDLKFCSCMTLFATLQQQPFEQAVAKFYGGKRDPKTLDLLQLS